MERDERRLAELGRRTIEMYVLSHLFVNRVEVAFMVRPQRGPPPSLLAHSVPVYPCTGGTLGITCIVLLFVLVPGVSTELWATGFLPFRPGCLCFIPLAPLLVRLTV